MLTLDKKKEIVRGLEEAFEKAKSIVFVKFNKLPVSETISLRRGLRASAVGYKVARKSLIKRALESKKIDGELPNLEGEVAVAFSEDLIAPAREVYSFQKTHKENLSILGGVFEGKYMNQVEMLNIATIPSLLVLRGQFVNLINSPIQGLVVSLSEIAKKKA